MKTLSGILEIIENRVRNLSRMKKASRDIDQRRKKAQRNWDSVEIIRQMRQTQR